MITDKETLLSEAQAITASAASTNIYDTKSTADVGVGTELEVAITIDEAFNNLTSLAFALQTDDNASFSSATTLFTQTVVLAGLTLGAAINLPCVPAGCERYLRLYYTVTGTAPTTGKVTAGIVLEKQLWKALPASAL